MPLNQEEQTAATRKKGDGRRESSRVLNHEVPGEASVVFVSMAPHPPTGSVHFLRGSVHSKHSFQIFAECFHGLIDS